MDPVRDALTLMRPPKFWPACPKGCSLQTRRPFDDSRLFSFTSIRGVNPGPPKRFRPVQPSPRLLHASVTVSSRAERFSLRCGLRGFPAPWPRPSVRWERSSGLAEKVLQVTGVVHGLPPPFGRSDSHALP
jgi:hypothetical protein